MVQRWVVLCTCALLYIGCTHSQVDASIENPPSEGEFQNIIVWQMSKRQVTFDHATHAMEYADDCTTCHHTSEEGEGQTCRKCHPTNKRNRTDDSIVRIVAMHKQCKGCHRNMEAGPYDSCDGCHVPRIESVQK